MNLMALTNTKRKNKQITQGESLNLQLDNQYIHK